MQIFIPPVIVKPEPEDQQKARSEIEKEKDIYLQFDHTENIRGTARSP